MDRLLKLYPSLLPFQTAYGCRTDHQSDAFILGKLGLVKHTYSIGKPYKKYGVAWAAANGHLSMVKYLLRMGDKCSHLAVIWTITTGRLEMVKYLLTHYRLLSRDLMDRAAECGQTHVLQYFLSLGMVATNETMDTAAEWGHLDAVQYLHSVGLNGTKDARIQAAENGKLSVLKYLHSIPGGKCIGVAMFSAVKHSQLEVFQYLSSLVDAFPNRVTKWIRKHPYSRVGKWVKLNSSQLVDIPNHGSTLEKLFLFSSLPNSI